MSNTKIREKSQKDFVFILLFGNKGMMVYFCTTYVYNVGIISLSHVTFSHICIEHAPNTSINQGYYM